MHDYPPFPGFREEAFAFLRALKKNNRREWFKPRKTVYDDEVLWPLRCLVIDAARQAHQQQLPLTADPRASLFRIYRDTRFSKNKAPYKTHAGAVLSRSGSLRDEGSVYIHIEPGASFLGAGFWHPDPALLRRWRAQMAAAPDAFLDVTRHLAAKNLSFGHADDTLKRLPRGYEALAETDIADYLKWKSFVVTRPIEDAALHTPAFTDEVVRMMVDVLPLLAYGWHCETARVDANG